jgi:hypothetical protein
MKSHFSQEKEEIASFVLKNVVLNPCVDITKRK